MLCLVHIKKRLFVCLFFINLSCVVIRTSHWQKNPIGKTTAHSQFWQQQNTLIKGNAYRTLLCTFFCLVHIKKRSFFNLFWFELPIGKNSDRENNSTHTILTATKHVKGNAYRTLICTFFCLILSTLKKVHFLTCFDSNFPLAKIPIGKTTAHTQFWQQQNTLKERIPNITLHILLSCPH